MPRPLIPILNTVLFTIVVPGTVAGYIPYRLTDRFAHRASGPLEWLGVVVLALGAAVYFRCAWEFAMRGLGTPAPIAPTKFLVTTALHRYIRNPMYVGVVLVIVGEAVLFRSLHILVYAAFMLTAAHTFVVLYEEPTLSRQFGEPYEQYRRTVPRWIPKFPSGNNPAK
ncbi:MAG TPA: isoprenylcysteine carboxylmethyltransferase family protein [Candidatus Binatia bacterium]|nr:isoprenylcysteine carboxylmethyltransferase family protein [Candidatus Binatia bacterium]